MKYNNITIAGGGVLGSQLAFQIAYSGYNVTVYVNEKKAVKEAKKKITALAKAYKGYIKEMTKGDVYYYGIAKENCFNSNGCLSKVLNAEKNIKYVTDLNVALNDCDLLIESIPEIKEIKRDFFKSLKGILEDKTVVVTNSSTLLPSMFAKYIDKPERFLALHFANAIYKNNTAEVMKHDKTDQKYFDEIIEFSKTINMIPLPIMEEKSGYLLNSLLVPFLLSGLDLLVNGISDVESIDKAWKMGTGAPRGPFEIFDVIGLITALNIVEQYQKVPDIFDPLLKKMMMPYNFDGMKEVLEKYISEGKLGRQTGEGFYKYDNK